MTLFLGKLEVKLMHIGPGHTRGDAIAWIPSQKICFSGDLVEYSAGVYTGDAQLEEWPATLEALRALGAAEARARARPGAGESGRRQQGHRLHQEVGDRPVQHRQGGCGSGQDLKQVFEDTRKVMDPVFGQVFIYEHCLPFDVSRAYDEAQRHQDAARLDGGARRRDVEVAAG